MKNKVILITRPMLGTVAPEDIKFGHEMLDKFLHNLEKPENRPAAIIFYTEGVKAAVKGGGFELPLQILRDLGVEMYLCQSCLNYYGLKEEDAIGTVTGMDHIIELMHAPHEVVRI
ncbi:MAG: DsrE family protein [bacterium]|nr:DsrE family protein [bacterium]